MNESKAAWPPVAAFTVSLKRQAARQKRHEIAFDKSDLHKPIMTHPKIKFDQRPVAMTDYGWFCNRVRNSLSKQELLAQWLKRQGGFHAWSHMNKYDLARALVEHDYYFNDEGKRITKEEHYQIKWRN